MEASPRCQVAARTHTRLASAIPPVRAHVTDWMGGPGREAATWHWPTSKHVGTHVGVRNACACEAAREDRIRLIWHQCTVHFSSKGPRSSAASVLCVMYDRIPRVVLTLPIVSYSLSCAGVRRPAWCGLWPSLWLAPDVSQCDTQITRCDSRESRAVGWCWGAVCGEREKRRVQSLSLPLSCWAIRITLRSSLMCLLSSLRSPCARAVLLAAPLVATGELAVWCLLPCLPCKVYVNPS